MLIFDIEADGLLDTMTKIHCINIWDTETDKHERYDPANLPVSVGVGRLAEADKLCGHSIIAYDIPAIKKIYPNFTTTSNLIDTKILSRLLYPNIKDTDYIVYRQNRLPKEFMQQRLAGTHKLAAWGFRLGVLKGEYALNTDWQTWDIKMSDYCEQDVVVTRELWYKQAERGYSQEAYEIERDVEVILQRQEANGIRFNKEEAEDLYAELLEKRETLRDSICETFPPFYKKGIEFTPKRDNERMHYTEGAAMTKITLVDFNPASQDHIARMLMRKYDWIPTELTPKDKKPKVNETILGLLPYPEAKILTEFLTLNKRVGQIAEGKQAWLNKVTPEGKIHGAINTMGAVTRRMAHFNPNLAQVPAPYSPYGGECRALFGPTREGWVQVGIDADGLEMACLGHFMALYDKGEFIKVFKEGDKKAGTDQHSLNAGILGCSRTEAKTWFYAYIYGAGNGKLGAILGKKSGLSDRRKFERGLPALGTLVEKVKLKAKSHGYLLSIDRQPVPTRALHSALNTLCQSAGAIIMKKALVLLDTKLQETELRPGVDYEFMLNVHDEWQIETKPKFADVVGQFGCVAITKAGEHFKFRCPLSGSYDVGTTWADCH